MNKDITAGPYMLEKLDPRHGGGYSLPKKISLKRYVFFEN